MKFSEFVLKNTIRNKNLYMAYFFSTLTTVMTFFTFTVFVFHPDLSDNLNASVKSGMKVSSIIIYIFSFFYVLYSMDIFLQSRKKEFGVLLIQGMSPKQLKKMIFQENSLIGVFATLVGILFGFFFSQIILWLSKIIIQVKLPFYFPSKAISVTFVSFVVLFLCISFFIQFKIPKMDIQELLKSQDLGKGELKSSWIKSVLSFILIGSGFILSMSFKGVQIITIMIPVIVLVVVGTKLLFDQVSIFVVNLLKRNKKRFWKKTNMLIFSDLGFRMKDNARSFFLVTIITTVAFSAIGTLIGFKELTLRNANIGPYDISVEVTKENAENEENQIEAINNALDNHNVAADEVKINALTVDGSLCGENGTVTVVDINDYNAIADSIEEDAVTSKDNEVVRLVNISKDKENKGNERAEQLQIAEDNSFKIVDMPVSHSPWSASESTYVVNDETYQLLSNSSESKTYYGWSVSDGRFNDQLEVGKDLESFTDIAVKASLIQTVTTLYAPILFVGFFIGIVFFISAGSFLYFRLYSDMGVDIDKFKMIYKLGFSKKEMKKVVYRQVGILFFTPILVSCVNGLVALKAMYALFEENFKLTAIYVLLGFIAIQLVYYLIARVFYFKKLYRSVVN